MDTGVGLPEKLASVIEASLIQAQKKEDEGGSDPVTNSESDYLTAIT